MVGRLVRTATAMCVAGEVVMIRGVLADAASAVADVGRNASRVEAEEVEEAALLPAPRAPRPGTAVTAR
jgi:hypothetical protein